MQLDMVAHTCNYSNERPREEDTTLSLGAAWATAPVLGQPKL